MDVARGPPLPLTPEVSRAAGRGAAACPGDEALGMVPEASASGLP